MRKIVSKIIVGIFKVLVPLFYIFFILAGLACALVTSVIAYQTVVELFPKNATVGIFSIPLLIVISFEVTKVFIIFLNKQYSDSKNEKYLINKSMFLTLRGLLIAISGILTLLYTFYNLDNPELDTRLAQQTEIINSANTQQRADINANFDRQITSINTSYDNQIQPFKDEMKAQEKFRYANGELRGPEWNAANQNVQQFNQKRNEALQANEQARITALNNLTSQSVTQISDAETKLKSNNASSNKMINSMLSVVTFNPDYSKGLYLFTIFVLSVLISIAMEFVIWASFTVLAINHGDFFEIDLEMKHLDEKHSMATETIEGITNRDTKSRIRNLFNASSLFKKKAKEAADESIDKISKI